MQNLTLHSTRQFTQLHLQLRSYKWLTCLLAFLISSLALSAQSDAKNEIETCGTMAEHERMLQQNPDYAKNRAELEKRIQEITKNRNGQNASGQREQDLNGIITIPVVFHVIHNGDPIAQNVVTDNSENIPDALLLAQLDQLNDDFRRLNSDANETPAIFTELAADIEIEFCLAAVDEFGSSNTGINRYNINTDLIGVSESHVWTTGYIGDSIISKTMWDPTKFLNIWTVRKIQKTNGDAGILGYAYLPGQAVGSNDGAVLLSTVVGALDMPNLTSGYPQLPSSARFGRAATHEAGHYLNLEHIWGGGDCSASDLVADTPNAIASTSSSVACDDNSANTCVDAIFVGTPPVAVDLPDMIQNYMDYSSGLCQNLFTKGQKTRMRAAIEASRPELITSACGVTPVNDIQAGAEFIDCFNNTFSGFLGNATSSDSPDPCNMPINTPGVWFTMSGEDAMVTLSSCPTAATFSINVYRQVGSDLVCVPTDVFISQCFTVDVTRVTFASIAGENYYIYVSEGSGSFTFNLSCEDFVCPSQLVYVNKEAPSGGDGTSWASAYNDLQDAIDAAYFCNQSGIFSNEIWVAQGTYLPTQAFGGTTDRHKTFYINRDVTVRGGFQGTEVFLSQRDLANAVTILSGDIGIVGNATDNSYHVVTMDGTSEAGIITNACLLDGFQIIEGNANGGGVPHNYAGGILNNGTGAGHESSPTILNCSFYNNSAATSGGAIWNSGFTDGASSPIITNCAFYSNSAGSLGGAMYNRGDAGGGETNPLITNCSFYNNTALNGGAINNFEANTITIENCIFWGNSATDGEDEIGDNGAGVTILNYSLISDDTPDGTVTLPSGVTGSNNIDANPLFVDASNYNLRLTNNSPARNTGNNPSVPFNTLTDLGGNPRITDSTVDMGAYENTCSSARIYVNQLAAAGGDGSTWATAFTNLQDGLDLGVCDNEIWVAQGTYLPTKTFGGATDRHKTFYINGDVKIWGGFQGTEQYFTQRDLANAITILSGDIGILEDATDNAFHVVTMDGTSAAGIITNDCLLDGFHIVEGNADGGGVPHNYAGGIFNNGEGAENESSPTILNCSFYNNSAATSGGAMWNSGLSDGASSPMIINCAFYSNSAGSLGGAMYNRGDTGGGETNPSITNCSFYNNTAIKGGAINNFETNFIAIKNCIFWGNSATNGENEIADNGADFTILTYSLIDDGMPDGTTTLPVNITGGSNIDANPIFVDAPNGNLRLKGCSPAINMASTTAFRFDLDGNPRNGAFDIGAYEYQSEVIPADLSCYQDLDGDGLGNSEVLLLSCTTCPNGWVIDNTDCNDLIPGNPPAPIAPSLTSPIDGATDLYGIITFDWTDETGIAVTYELEIATDSGFNNIVSSAANLTISEIDLSGFNTNTSYYWRVRATNICGPGPFSSGFSFTFANCQFVDSADVPVTIVSDATSTNTSILSYIGTGDIIDINVSGLIGSHTYVNDLVISLTSPEGTTVVLFDQVCGYQDNFNVNFDDDASSGVLPCPPNDGGLYQPEGSLASFNGEDPSGIWTLTIFDVFDEDGGALTNWALDICESDTEPECLDDIAISASHSSGIILEEASTSISSSELVSGTAEVSYSAGQEINLTAGFSVDSGAKFHAYIMGCVPD